MEAARADRRRATSSAAVVRPPASSSTVVRPPASRYAAEATADRHLPAGHAAADPTRGQAWQRAERSGRSCVFPASPGRTALEWRGSRHFARGAVSEGRLAQLRAKQLPKLLAELCQTHLDDRFRFVHTDRRRLDVILQILGVHRGPARRLALTSLLNSSNLCRYDDRFPLPIFDTLQELVLHFPCTPDHLEMPATALRFRCLRVLDLDNCTFFTSGCSPAFPCLTYLSLCHVGITEELLHGMISNSPGIEHIMLDTNFGHRRLCLSLPRLRCLAVSVKVYRRVEEIVELEDIIIEDAASLERVLLHEVNYGPSVRITKPTKLKMLGYLGTGFPIIQLGHTIFKAMVPVSLVNQFSSLTMLALQIPEPKLKVVIGYLTCFPCLEKLDVKILLRPWTSLKCALRWNPSVPIVCLDRSMKTIVLQSYAGLRTHVEFAKFLIKRARVLEVMKFCCFGYYTSRWLQKQYSQLNIKNRVSWHAKFPFVRPCDLPSRFWMDECFSSEDPFEETGPW